MLEFIVLEARYDAAMAVDRPIGSNISIVAADEIYHGTIVKVEPCDPAFPESPWRSLNIAYEGDSDDTALDCCSPWELQLDEATLSSIFLRVESESDLTVDEISRMSLILESLLTCATFRHFAAPVDLKSYPKYVHSVCYLNLYIFHLCNDEGCVPNGLAHCA